MSRLKEKPTKHHLSSHCIPPRCWCIIILVVAGMRHGRARGRRGGREEEDSQEWSSPPLVFNPSAAMHPGSCCVVSMGCVLFVIRNWLIGEVGPRAAIRPRACRCKRGRRRGKASRRWRRLPRRRQRTSGSVVDERWTNGDVRLDSFVGPESGRLFFFLVSVGANLGSQEGKLICAICLPLYIWKFPKIRIR